MDQLNPFAHEQPAPDARVITLRCQSVVQFDRQALVQVFANRPQTEVEEMICRILESIAQWLDLVEQALAAGDADQITKPARRIGVLAGQIGLTELTVAAAHVGRCAAAGDGFALAATVARLERAFDQTVAEVWDFRPP